MKRNTLLGMFFIGAVALSSCSTQNKLASPQAEDDVYYTKAKAGDVAYTETTADSYKHDYGTQANSNSNTSTYDDYYAYDSYSARLNRFYSYSPYVNSYYSDFWYGGNPYYSGLSIGLGFGAGSFYNGYYNSFYSPYGYGYNPYYSNPYYAYNPYGYGTLYGYGASPYWGVNSYYNTYPAYNGTPRPSRPGLTSSRSSGNNSVYYGGYPTTTPATTRPVRAGYVSPGTPGGRPVGNTSTTTTNTNTTTSTARPVRTQDTQPVYTPPTRPTYTPAPQSYPSSSGSSSSSSSSSGSSNSGGGSSSGPRPVRP